MGRRLLVFSAVLAMLTCVYLARSSYALHGIKTATYSPDRMYGAIVDGRAIVRKRWRLGRPTEQRDTTLSIVRAENPYTERPSTGPNPERSFLTASCPSSDFTLKWVDNSSLEVTIQGCTPAQISDKKAQIGDVSIRYL